jgi:hypothetical protein
MSSVSIPYVSAQLVPGITGVSLERPRMLVVGTVPQSKNSIFDGDPYKLLSVSPLSSYESVPLKDLATTFGTGELYHRLKYAQFGVNKAYPIDILLVKNNTSTAATTTITFANNAVEKGTLSVDVFNGFEFSATVAYEAGATPTALATAVVSQLNTGANKPFAAANVAGVVTLTWVDGFVSQSVPIHVVLKDAATTAVVSHVANVVPTQPGSDVFDAIGDTRYTSILWPEWLFNSVGVANSLLLDRFNTFNRILDGVVYTTITESYSNILLNTQTLQGQPMSFWADRKVNGLFGASIGSNNKAMPDVRMAFVAGAIDRYRTEGADLTDIVSSANGLLDYTGGVALASLPYHNIPVPKTKPSNPLWYFDNADQSSLNDFNLSTWGVNRAGVQEITGRARTMWKVDAAGNENKTWSPLEHLWTSSVVREYQFLKVKQYLAKMRLTGGALVIGRSMTNATLLKEELIGWYSELAKQAIVLDGGEYIASFAKKLTVSIVPEDQNVIIAGVYPIVTHDGAVYFTIQTVVDYSQSASV